jgi:exodeoxyribonuclease VII small subunit
MTDDLANLTFEEAMRELESIVRDLETGKAKLDDAVRAYERGAALKAHCEGKLAGAQAKIEQITARADEFATAGRSKPPPQADRNRHLRPIEFATPARSTPERSEAARLLTDKPYIAE